MSRQKVALDCDVPRRLVEAMNALYGDRGFEFIHVTQMGLATAEDDVWAKAFKQRDKCKRSWGNLVQMREEMQTYLFAYSFEGSRWMLEIQASSADEARERLKRIPYATYTGKLVAKLPAVLSPLGIIAVWLRNAYKAFIYDSFGYAKYNIADRKDNFSMQLSDDFPLMSEREAGMAEHVPALAVAFGLYPVKDTKKSAEAGREVHKDVEFVKICIPGDRNCFVFQPADASHKRRFPKAYQAFKEREHSPIEGTRIEEWAPISRSVALNLKTLHIHTVESLADVHDGMIDRLGSNGRELRERAKAWLVDAKSGAATQQLAADKKALQDQLAALQAQITAMQQNGAKPAPAAPVTPEPEPADDAAADVAAAARRPRKSAA